MRTLKKGLFFTVFFGLFVLFELFPYPAAAYSCGDWCGRLVSLQGSAQVMRTGNNTWEPLIMGDHLFPGDNVRVGSLSRTAIQLNNDATLRLDQNSIVTFPGMENDAPLMLRIVEGTGHIFSRFPRSLDFETPFAHGTVESTEFLLAVAADRTQITVYDGRVILTNSAGTLAVDAGKRAVATAGRPPEFIAAAHPREALHWTLHYPAVMEVTPDDFPGANGWQESVRNAIDDYRRGHITAALDRITALPDTIDDPLFYTYRAMLLMAVGRTNEAKADIQKALTIDPVYAPAFALKSVMALVQNNKTGAMEWAKKAEAVEPHSPTAQIALSYLNQAGFNPKAALSNSLEAVRLAPENALARTRLAELRYYQGHLDKAESALKRASALNPYLTHPHTILGFIHLADFQTQKAVETFNIAVEQDPAAPLPRLGLGLAKIKKGDLDEGRRQIEIAVSLDPDNSLLRSYLGKAYHDEKRNENSGNQLSAAKELDPDDPTPWLYDAIRKQTENRPVEALKDLQKSIANNDNRTAYRSRLLLDEDRAVRSAGLGRIYQDLGFNQLALSEGFKSINADPGDYSAHRFLADNYAALPRNDTARVSELLQSQLLQPINITPISPRLGQIELSIHQGTGPSAPAFNEFTNLYERDRPSAQLSDVIGGNDTWGDEAAVSVLYENLSFSAGQFHYETDGFRDNNDQKWNIYNAFGQVAISHETSIQAEYRYQDVDKGDLPLLFDPENSLDNFRQKDRKHNIRGGFKHGFGPGSDLIGSLIYGETDINAVIADTISLPPPIGPFDSDIHIKMPVDSKGYVAEAQHILKKDKFHLTSGGGYYHNKDIEVYDISFHPELPPILTGSYSSDTTRTNHSYLYLYSTIRFPEDFSWTIGGAADFFDDDEFEEKRTVNPKLGMTWTPTSKTTVRAALFNSYTRVPISRQTIEPTQVAGFNQFYHEAKGTESWLYGLGIDQKFSETIFGGLQLSGRDAEIPYIDLRDENKVKDSTEHIDLYRFYLSLAPMDWVSINLQYIYEKYIGDEDAPFYDTTEVSTNRIPIGFNLFLPKDITLSTTATYVSQNGKFFYPDFEKDDDQFWVVDAGIRYRLPKRYGTVSIEAKNLFNESFKFLDTDMWNPTFYPERLILGKFTLAF